MKKINYLVAVFMICLAAAGCNKNDNYSGPNAAVNGTIIDAVTGKGLQNGPMDVTLHVLQTNYTAGTPVPFYWNVMPTGAYNNSEVFAENYNVYPMGGPFVPLVYTNNGTLVDNGSKNITIKAGQTVTTDFTVTPFLVVTWVGNPVVNSDGTVTIQCTVTRGTSDPLWTFNVTDVFFFVSETQYVGSGAQSDYDPNLSTDVTYSGTAGNAILGTTLTITSKAPLLSHATYFLRVGARTADNINKRYNYTTVNAINIP